MHTTALPASFLNPIHALSLGLARTIHIQCIYGIFGRDITKITVIYGAYIRFWPTLTYIHTSATGGCTVACVRVHLCVFTQATTHKHTLTRTHTCAHTHTCTHTRAHTHAHTRTHTCTHTHTHAHTHTHTNTHTHTYFKMFRPTQYAAPANTYAPSYMVGGGDNTATINNTGTHAHSNTPAQTCQ